MKLSREKIDTRQNSPDSAQTCSAKSMMSWNFLLSTSYYIDYCSRQIDQKLLVGCVHDYPRLIIWSDLEANGVSGLRRNYNSSN